MGEKWELSKTLKKADGTIAVVWEGKLYRLEIEGQMMQKNEIAEQIQDEYPGAIVHNVYPGEAPSKIKSAKRYQPERLNWSD